MRQKAGVFLNKTEAGAFSNETKGWCVLKQDKGRCILKQDKGRCVLELARLVFSCPNNKFKLCVTQRDHVLMSSLNLECEP